VNDLLCHLCGLPADGAFEERDGEWWVYCPSCDTWTCHPIPKEK